MSSTTSYHWENGGKIYKLKLWRSCSEGSGPRTCKAKNQGHQKKAPADGVNKVGRPSPRAGNVARMTLLLSEDTAERLTIALATEQVKRRKAGEKVDKSLLIEEAILAWLEGKGL